MRWLIAAAFLTWSAAAQTFTLGSASDPCSGGTAWTVTGAPIPTLRFSSLPFSCSFNTGSPGAFLVELDFVEPSTYVPASDPNGRAFNVSVTDAWGFQSYGQILNFDLFTAGAKSAAVMIARSFIVFSQDGKITVSLSTVKRSAVISRVIITRIAIGMLLIDQTAQPGTIADSISRWMCVGKMATSDCGGMDLYTFKFANGSRTVIATPATSEQLALPNCPAPSPCWHTASVYQ